MDGGCGAVPVGYIYGNEYMSLKEKGTNSVIWAVFENIFIQGFSFVVAIFLTRLLLPEEFGLVGIIMVFIVTGNSIIEGGLGSSLVRDNEANSVDFSTVFYGNLVMSFLVYGIIFVSAPFIANFFDQPLLKDLIRVMALGLIVSGFSIVQQKLLIRDLAFKKLTFANLPAIITGAVAALILAFMGYGVWSLVARDLVTRVVKAFIFWHKSNWRPSLVFDLPKFKFHFNFGYKLMLSSLLNSIFSEIYSLVIGKNFSVTVLGFYNRGKTYNLLTVKTVSQVISKTTYPLLSKIKEDKEKISEVYRSLMRAIFFFVVPLMFTLTAVAEPLFLWVFTEKWLPAVPFFQILTFANVLRPIHLLNLNGFKIFGRTDLTLKLAVIKKAMVGVVVAVGLIWGIFPMLWGMVASSLLSLIINTWYGERMIGYSTRQQFRDMAPTFLTGIFSAWVGYYSLEYLSSAHYAVQLIVVAVLVLGLYILTNLLIKNRALREFLRYIVPILRRVRNMLKRS